MEETKETKKLSYEELENVARKLVDNCNKLQNELQRVTMDNIFKRLDYLFKVLENKESFTSEFISSCANEIMEVMTLKEIEEDNPEVKEEA